MSTTAVDIFVISIAFVGGLVALFLAIIGMRLLLVRGVKALRIIAIFMLRLFISIVFDIRFIFFMCIALTVSMLHHPEKYYQSALILNLYFFVLSILFIIMGVLIEVNLNRLHEQQSKKIKISEMEINDVFLNFMRDFRITAGIFGLIGIVVSYTFCLITFDAGFNGAFGGMYPYGDYLMFAIDTGPLSALQLSDVINSVFMPDGERISIRSIRFYNEEAKLLAMIYKLTVGTTLLGFVFFIAVGHRFTKRSDGEFDS